MALKVKKYSKWFLQTPSDRSYEKTGRTGLASSTEQMVRWYLLNASCHSVKAFKNLLGHSDGSWLNNTFFFTIEVIESVYKWFLMLL